MKNQIRPVITLFILLAIVTGVIYPLIVTGLSQAFFQNQSNGSLIVQNETYVGSKLIGQNFVSDQYFWGRPSSTYGTPYNAFDQLSLTGSLGSNLGPLSQSLIDSVQDRVSLLQNADPSNTKLIPVNLVTASASGLDPHISVSAAYFQVPRIALSRGMSETQLVALVDKYTERPQFGLLGEFRVNVLLLNLALDRIK